MLMHSIKHKLVIALVAGAILLSGCGAEEATCGDYKKMSEDDQNKVVKALLKKKTGKSSKDAEAIMRMEISTFCAFADPETKIIETLGK